MNPSTAYPTAALVRRAEHFDTKAVRRWTARTSFIPSPTMVTWPPVARA